jgi:Uri superfamily endonuclease
MRPRVTRHLSHIDRIRWTAAAVDYICDAPRAVFLKARLTDGASATTINRSLEVVRTILPPLITMLHRRV